MADRSFLQWPFFDERTTGIWADRVDEWAGLSACRYRSWGHVDDDLQRRLVAALGDAGWLKSAAVDPAETLRASTCAACASCVKRWRGMTGWRTLPLPCRGLAPGRFRCSARRSRKRNGCTNTRAGKALSAFALTEPASGSDVANMAMTATRDGDDLCSQWREDLDLQWRDRRCLHAVFARTGEAPGAKGLSAFIVPAGYAGVLEIAERLDVVAPHPLARLRFDDCRIPASAMIGARARLQASPCRCSTCFARPWPRPHWALPGGRLTRALPRYRSAIVRRADERSADGAGAYRRHGA
jgi:acyl-CoA dehydrogenase